MNTNSDSVQTLREAVVRSTISQERLAITLGYDPAVFSRILRGLRPVPAEFEGRVRDTLRLLEAAERAAEEARRRVLASEE